MTALRLLPLLLLAASLGAQTAPPRYALVVGNGNYPYASLDKTPANDAGAMRDALTLAGFQVDYFTDLDQTKLNNAVTAFGRKIKGSGGVALFYYSGHGVQHNNQNYLVPIGAELTDEEDIEGLCIPINRITAKMQGAGTTINLVVLDACRAFPLSRTGKTLAQGLAKETYAVPELLVAYATAPGSTATVRGEGGLSLYTSQLLKHLKTPGLVLENVLKNTRRDVLTKSNNQQRPDETGNLTSDFYFFPATAQPDPTPTMPNAKEVPSATNPTAKTGEEPNAFPDLGDQKAPDRDRDGIPDATDPCPDDYGTLAASGCPDSDEDGVPNSVDQCPNLAGKQSWQGCPDSDHDGLPDHEDQCPTEKGTKADKGCPPLDRDRDGILDADDFCPDHEGLKSLDGCPDGDGVADKNDKCPDTAGLPKYKGCPDSDGDGTPDHEDLCPTVKGFVSDKGCPDLRKYGYLPDYFVHVPGGTFSMGNNENDDEKPVHNVTVPTFEMSKYEVTNAQFCLFLNDISSLVSVSIDGDAVLYEGQAIFKKFCGDKKGGCSGFSENIEYILKGKHKAIGKFGPVKGYENNPAVMVSWHGAVAYCEWLSQKTGQTYRLPSEAEWEYAAKGGNQSKIYKYSGSNTISYVAWHASNSGSKAHPVGEKAPNELGLHDMSGNVWEWCADTWHISYTGAPTTGAAWIYGGDQDRAVLRGGSWDGEDVHCRSANRYLYLRTEFLNYVGWRVVRVP